MSGVQFTVFIIVITVRTLHRIYCSRLMFNLSSLVASERRFSSTFFCDDGTFTSSINFSSQNTLWQVYLSLKLLNLCMKPHGIAIQINLHWQNSCIVQLNLSTMAAAGTEESGHCREVQNESQCIDYQEMWLFVEKWPLWRAGHK